MAPPAPAGQRRVALGWALRLAMWTGTVLVLFAGWSLWGTGILAARAQDQLTADFERSLSVVAEPAPAPESRGPIGREVETPTAIDPVPRAIDENAPPPPAGSAVALLKIPRIGVQQAVVEGVSLSALAKGPGHYPGTPMPGEPGNVAIAGHRTTFGAPFFHVDKLQRDDLILVTTKAGVFRYRVAEVQVVRPSQREVLLAKGDDRLTLTTCHPAYRATERLVVVAHPEVAALAGPPPVPVPAPPTTEVPTPVEEPPATLDVEQQPDFSRFEPVVPVPADQDAALEMAGPSFDGARERLPWLALLTWSAAAAATWAAMLRVGRRRRWLARLVGTPVLLGGLIGVFETVARMLPGGV